MTPCNPLGISVIIPAYNAEETLGEQLEALRAQVYDGEWEVIVADNRSVDGTVDVVKQHQKTMPNLRLVDASDKQGRSFARNRGAQEAHGDAFLFCDADDVVAPGWISAFARALEKHEFIAGSIEVEMLNPGLMGGKTHIETGSKVLDWNFMPTAWGSNAAISREAFEKVGGFSEDFERLVDTDISWRLQMAGFPLHDEPDAIIHFKFRESLNEMWKQDVTSGKMSVLLYRRYRASGMPRLSLQKVMQKYKWLLIALPRVWSEDPNDRRSWLRIAARSWGRIVGTIRYRSLFL